MKQLGRTAATVALSFVAAIGLSGCPALLIPGLAVEAVYEGYKYKKSRSESPQPGSAQSQSSSGDKKRYKKIHKRLHERHRSSA